MKNYFLIGIKGKGMQALAKYLILEKSKVEGYDDNKKADAVYTELKELGIKIYNKLSSKDLLNKEVIVTPAISSDRLKKYQPLNIIMSLFLKLRNQITPFVYVARSVKLQHQHFYLRF